MTNWLAAKTPIMLTSVKVGTDKPKVAAVIQYPKGKPVVLGSITALESNEKTGRTF